MDDENEIIDSMSERIREQCDRFQSSYHGLNCRTCNRHPSHVRKLYWRLEDIYWKILKWYYKEESVTIMLGDLFPK